MLSAAYVTADLAPGHHHDTEDLILEVTPEGERRWLFSWETHGRHRTGCLGNLATVDLDCARARASLARRSLPKPWRKVSFVWLA